MNKAKEIRAKFMRPMLFLVVIMSCAIFILFNVVLYYTLDASIKSSLRYAGAALEQVSFYTDLSLPEIRTHFADFANNTSGLGSINLIITNNQGQPVFLYEHVPEGVVTQIVGAGQADGQFAMADTTEGKYYVLEFMGKNTASRFYLLASAQGIHDVMKSCNKALSVILVCTTLLFVAVLYAITTHISIPIKRLSKHADDIGNGLLMHVPVRPDSVELQRLAESLDLMVDKLKAFSEAQKLSLQNLSHELRTPLMSIQGYAEGIKYGVVDDNAQAAEVIIDESKKLSSIVDQILILSRLDTLNQPVSIAPVNLREFISEEITLINGYALKHDKQLTSHIQDSQLMVLADAQLLNVVVTNILSNAVRYAKQNIEIYAEVQNKQATISFVDDGSGFSQEDLKYLFDRFYKGNAGNFGLGMSIAKSSMEYMNGSICAMNNVQGGATIQITLPI